MIAFIQLPIPFATNLEVTGNLPLGAASIICHLVNSGENPENFHLVDQNIASRLGDQALVGHLKKLKPRQLCMTCTVWNIERSLHIARTLSQELPNLKVWLGGPEISSDFPLSDPVEIAFAGEGEKFFSSGETKALQTLKSIHDPYRSGLVRAEDDGVMFAEWGRGCRYRCAFCRYHQGHYSKQILRPDEQVKDCLSWARDNNIKEIYLLDPSLEQRKDLNDFLRFLAHENSSNIAIMAELRAEFINPERANLLAKAGINRVETGLQSLNKKTMKKLHRPLNTDSFLKGVTALKNEDIEVKTDLMTGLPGDSEESFKESLHFMKEHGLAQKLQIFRTQVLKGTELRERADEWGVIYQAKPPYQVLETKDWPREKLENSLAIAETILDTTFSIEEEPVLMAPDWSDKGSQITCFPGTKAAWYLAFNLDKDLPALEMEDFSTLASTSFIWLETEKPGKHRKSAEEAIEKLVQSNPFCTFFTGLKCPAGAALDIFDALNETLNKNRLSTYAADMYGTMASTDRPLRPLMAITDLSDSERVSRHWLEDLRELAQIIWKFDASCMKEALALVEKSAELLEQDYIFLNTSHIPSDLEDYFFRELMKTSYEPSAILLPGLELHWAYRRALAKKGDWDW